MHEYVASGVIVNGKLKVRNQRDFNEAMSAMADGEVVVTIEKRRATRSQRANRYYFGVCLNLISEATGHTVDELHDDMCLRFLTKRVNYTNPETGEVDEREVPGRSSKLNVNEFYDFVERVRQFGAEFLGLAIPDPDPEHWRDREDAA